MRDKLLRPLSNRSVRVILFDVLVVVLIACSVLTWYGLNADIDRVHVNGFGGALNDQVGFISVARNFAEKGVLESNIIYPSLMGQGASRNYPYMPGYYVVLGTSIRLFGDTVFAYWLPNLLSFIVAAVCVYLIALRLYGREIGIFSSFLFSIFPPIAAFTYTTMAELTVLASAALALCIVVYLPGKLKPLLGPFILILPFVFRETGALLVIPMMSLILMDRTKGTRLKTTAFFLGSILILMLVQKFEFSSGRGSLLMGHLFGGEPGSVAKAEAVYSDATWQPDPDLGWRDYWVAMATIIKANAELLAISLSRWPFSFELFSLIIIMMSGLVSLLHWVFRARSDLVPLGVGLLILLTLLLNSTLFLTFTLGGLRHLLFTAPLAAVVVGKITYDELVRNMPRVTVVAALLVGSMFVLKEVGGNMGAHDGADDASISFIEQHVIHDDKELLVAPFKISLPYVYRHHPVRWSFIPANDATLLTLQDRYGVGAVVLPMQEQITRITSEGLDKAGFYWGIALRLGDGQGFLVFRKPAGDGPQ